jgi:aconitate hydratase
MTVAKILKGKKAHQNVSFVVTPGSKEVLENITRDGGLELLLSAGARLTDPTCGFCIGNSQSPRTKAVSLRTNNRNFEGRSGTKDAQVYLVSPQTAAAAVITGEITDPRTLECKGTKYPHVTMPKKFYIDDSMFIFPPTAIKKREAITIIRGPNIGEPPNNTPLPDTIIGQVTLKVGDLITTDHIIPAGARMKYRSNVPKYSEFLFENVDPKFHERAQKNKEHGIHNIIVAGLSYGQGSSREHAAICPMYMGVKAILAKSMERIHKANLINFGIVPLTFTNNKDYDTITQGDGLEIKGLRTAIATGKNQVTVTDTTTKKSFTATFDLSERDRKIILAGGTLNLMGGKEKP